MFAHFSQHPDDANEHHHKEEIVQTGQAYDSSGLWLREGGDEEPSLRSKLVKIYEA